MASIEIKNH